MTSLSPSTTWLGLDLRWAYESLLPAIWRRTLCVHRAQDVLHDAFLRYALSQRPSPLRQPNAYLRVVVQSVLADHAAEAGRYVALPQPGVPPSPEGLAELQQRLAAMQKLIDGLPPRCRDVFWLCRVEGYTQPEIAQRLGISLNMVERHMIRALLDLRAARAPLAP